MSLDVLGAKPGEDLFEYCPKLKDIRCFTDYKKDPDPAIDTEKLIAYVVLLYSKDSFLNKRPIENLRDRRTKAATLVGLDYEDERIIQYLFNLDNDKILDLILGYLIYQNNTLWTERTTIEIQMDESQRIRMRPVDSDKDKDLLEAFNKKASLTLHFATWYKILKEYDAEIFFDHDDVKEKNKRQRTSLEAYAK